MEEKDNIVCCDNCIHKDMCAWRNELFDYDANGYGCTEFYTKKLIEENKQLKQLKAKELGEALVPAFETIATKLKYIFNSIDTPTLIDIMQRSVKVQNQKAIEELEKLRPLITRQTYICGGKATENEIVEANAYNRCLADIRDILDNQIKELRG